MTRCPRCQRRFPPSGECPAHGKPTGVGEVNEVDNLPPARPPSGWQLGRMLAIGGTAIVHELAGTSPAVLKWARWRDRDIRARFVVEADVLRSVGAPSTPALIDHGTVDDWPYLIMEYVTGETLATWMSRNGERGGLGEIIAILTRITNALGAVHEAGYVHRDLKPENISIGPRGARLLDFGLAKPLHHGTNLTQIGTVVGTPHYIAPEQIRMGSAVDERADIYSLGVIAYEMLAGAPPFVGERRAIEYQHQVGRPAPIRETRAIPSELDEVVLRCLAKQPDARPRSAAQLREELSRALTSAGTLRGVGGVTPSSPMKPLGNQTDVALAWIVGGDPVAITRAIGELQGIVVRQRGDGILAAFTALHHEAPLSTALAVCRELVRERCRIVVHATSALVRRSAQGKSTVYGKELERIEDWTPATPFVGLVLTHVAAARANTRCVAAHDVAGFAREGDTGAGTTDCGTRAAFVGRAALLEHITEQVAKPILLGISGEPGTGKSRFLDELVAKLRATNREVIHVRARRRFLGDRPDDDRVLKALADHADPILVIDDVDRLSSGLVDRLLRPMPLARVVTSARPLFEVPEGNRDRVAIELPALSHADAGALLREQLRPARLIPDVLIERLALRGVGNPRLLLALAHDMKRRGAVRRNAGSDEWYVAADELDTLLAPPGPSWIAQSAIDSVPSEVAPVLRACTALGPRFGADEVGHVTPAANASDALAFLQQEAIVTERNGWYELEDASLQQAIYEHLLDERHVIHARALAYWLGHDTANQLGRLARIAYHASGAAEPRIAAASWLTLSRAARRRGEADHADVLVGAARACVATDVPHAMREILAAVDDE